MEIEVDIIVLSQRIKICEIGLEEVLWTKSADGGHRGLREGIVVFIKSILYKALILLV